VDGIIADGGDTGCCRWRSEREQAGAGMEAMVSGAMAGRPAAGEIVLFSFFLDLIYFSQYVDAYRDRGSWAWAWRAGMELWKVHNFWKRDSKNK
jgi:hypothetical protein